MLPYVGNLGLTLSVVESGRSKVSPSCQGDLEKVLLQLGVEKPTEGDFCPLWTPHQRPTSLNVPTQSPGGSQGSYSNRPS